MKRLQSPLTRGFTLIELLIVVAIIAILAAIAVPNFLEAQVRAKVSRAETDMRTLATAIESYRVDNNNYPPSVVDAPLAPAYNAFNLRFTVFALLSTPISYISSYPQDAFKGSKDALNGPDDLRLFYDYRQVRLEDVSGDTTIQERATGFGIGIDEEFDSWLLYSPGPDKWQNINNMSTEDGTTVAGFGDPLRDWPFYDPTNGTISVGDIIRSPYGGADSLVSR